MPHEPSEAAVEAARDIVDRLKDHCTGHPDARIPWPHRVLHDAIAEIERLRHSASACPAVSVETLRRFGYAPGGYLCACKDCRRSYMADKKSWRCLACAAAAAETAPTTPPAGTVPPSERIDDIGGVSANDLLFALRVCGIEEGKAAALIRSAIDNGGLVLGARLRLYPPVPELPATVEAPDA